MELRHLRYFVAVAEEGSLTLAAERRLHTAQPSLSRQMRDLEREVGVPLMTRAARGIALTPAGRSFLDHARLTLAQVEAAGDAARRTAGAAKDSFVLGFLTGQEFVWFTEVMRVARMALPQAEILILSQSSPELSANLMRGRIDAALMRVEKAPGLVFRIIDREPLVVILPADHKLAEQKRSALRF
ncbi:MAG: LysR family transcriptional regulator [Alphaproteobacteria bacterium]